MQPEGAPPPKGAVPPPRQVGGGHLAGRKSGVRSRRATGPVEWGGAEPVARRGRARPQSKSEASAHAAMNGSAAEKHTRARP